MQSNFSWLLISFLTPIYKEIKLLFFIILINIIYHMELYQLKIFRDLASELSFVRVATINHITQPAVSFQVKKLEDELGIKLLDRAPRRVALTNEGRLLLPYVEEILKQSQNLKTLSGEVLLQPAGEVRIATIHSIGMYEIGHFLKQFLLICPRIHLRLQYLQASEIYDLILRKKIDLGVVAYPQSHPLIDTVSFGSDRLTLVIPPDHRFSRRQSVALSDLEGESFIAFDEGVPTREAIDELFRTENISVDIRMTNDNIYAIKSAVQANIGISIVPESSVQEEIRHGSLRSVSIRSLKLTRPRAIITRKKRPLTKAASLFLDSMIASVAMEA